MKPLFSFLISFSILLLGISCNNNPQPEEGKEYVKVEKGILLPVPDANDSTKFDYTKVKVTFESDGVYMHTNELMRNAMLSVEFKTPQYKTTFGSKEYNSSLGNRDRWLSHTQSLIPAVLLHTRRMFHNPMD